MRISLILVFGLILSLAFVGCRIDQSNPPSARTATRAAASQPAPFGIDKRVPWTTSRITGSPEPPPPFQTARAFPSLTFENPLDISYFPDGKRVAVLEQKGKLYSFAADENCKSPDLLLDITKVRGLDRIQGCIGVGDCYGIAFHPQFAKNHYLFVCYTLQYKDRVRNHENGSRVSRFVVSNTDPPTVDPASETIVLQWLGGGHNGGCLKFGPDGYLYISTGDGADPDPPDILNTGQDISDLLASILRIDVDHPEGERPYSIPPGNPFVHIPGARPEVYAYGLRNPWRMNFDRQTGNLWVGDVGWELWESIYCVKPAGNYGWSIMEGPNPVHPEGKLGPTPITPPAVTLPHVEADSVTGGVVYRGQKFKQLQGNYIFGDWQTRTLWAARCKGPQQDQLEPYQVIAQTDQKIVAFGEDPQGEPLIVDHGGGGLWRIAPNDTSINPADFPRKLSQTGLFASVRNQTPQPGVIPFSINAPQWLDGATARRWVAVPGTQVMSWGKGVWGDDKPAWPKDSVLVRTISLGNRNVETQVLHFDGKQWQAYAYAWNDQQDDANLVDATGDQKVLTIADPDATGKARRQVWNFASRAQCLTCHNVWCDYALAFNAPQLDRLHDFGGITDNQVRSFRHLGLLLEPLPPKPDEMPSSEKMTLTDPYDASADLYECARSYLHVNCSHCHRFGGGGTALFDVRKELSPADMKLIDARPNLGSFDLDNAKLISPANPAGSVVLFRMCKLGRGRMPHIGSDQVDVQGVRLIERWIASMNGNSAAGTSFQQARQADLRVLRSRDTDMAVAKSATQRLLQSASGALALLLKLQDGQIAGPFVKTVIDAGESASRDEIRDLFRRFNPAEQQIARLGPNINAKRLLSLSGDAERGRKIFFETGGTGLCARCHVANGRGSEFGPDLSHIASKYNRADLLDNILYPSKTIAPGYATYVVKTDSGDIYSGLLVNKTEREIVLKDPQLKLIHIPAKSVQKIAAQSISAMPEGLLGDLDAQQAADLLQFVATLK